jgi:hypothetical protein
MPSGKRQPLPPFGSLYVSARGVVVIATDQCRDVIGLGSASAAFRRPQFKQASTVIAKPAFRSTARSGNIVPRHLSHLCIDGLYHCNVG